MSTELTSEPTSARSQLEAGAKRDSAVSRSPLADLDVVHPLAALDDEEVAALVARDPAALGSISLGLPNRGALLNAVEFPESPYWKRADPPHAWGTRESVAFIEYAITRVNEAFPETPVLYVGDLSARSGGRLRPHKSHQSGRDVDIGYYYLNDSAWYRPANAKNLDRPRNWTLLKVLITQTPVEYVFMDVRIQRLLEEYALAHGEDPEWLQRVFGGKSNNSIVRHRRGHATHLHVRFENPTAELTARRSYAFLHEAGLLPGQRKGKKGRKGKRRPAQAPGYALNTRAAPADE